MPKKVLVPYNFSKHDEKVLRYITNNFVGDESIKITLLHLYTPIAKISTLNPAISTITEKLGPLIKSLGEKEAELENLKNYFAERGFSESQLNIMFKARKKSIGDDIVNIVNQENFDTIVIAHTPGKKVTYSYYTENIHAKLLSHLKDKEIIILT